MDQLGAEPAPDPAEERRANSSRSRSERPPDTGAAVEQPSSRWTTGAAAAAGLGAGVAGAACGAALVELVGTTTPGLLAGKVGACAALAGAAPEATCGTGAPRPVAVETVGRDDGEGRPGAGRALDRPRRRRAGHRAADGRRRGGSAERRERGGPVVSERLDGEGRLEEPLAARAAPVDGAAGDHHGLAGPPRQPPRLRPACAGRGCSAGRPRAEERALGGCRRRADGSSGWGGKRLEEAAALRATDRTGRVGRSGAIVPWPAAAIRAGSAMGVVAWISSSSASRWTVACRVPRRPEEAIGSDADAAERLTRSGWASPAIGSDRPRRGGHGVERRTQSAPAAAPRARLRWLRDRARWPLG